MWCRYVNDVLCIWTGAQNDLSQILHFMNNLHPSNNFKVEIGGSKINFLDLTISLLPNKFEFEIYRKTTTTDILIHGSSFCPFPHIFDTQACILLPLIYEGVLNQYAKKLLMGYELSTIINKDHISCLFSCQLRFTHIEEFGIFPSSTAYI